MACQECGSEGWREVVVGFTAGSERETPLCDDSRDVYQRSTLVAGVYNK